MTAVSLSVAPVISQRIEVLRHDLAQRADRLAALLDLAQQIADYETTRDTECHGLDELLEHAPDELARAHLQGTVDRATAYVAQT